MQTNSKKRKPIDMKTRSQSRSTQNHDNNSNEEIVIRKESEIKKEKKQHVEEEEKPPREESGEKVKGKSVDYKIRLRDKRQNEENRRLQNRFHRNHLKKLKLRVGMRNIRSKFQNRVKNSIKNHVNVNNNGTSKHFKPYVQSIVLKIEMKTRNKENQSNKTKNILTIPLYVEVFAQASSSKSNDIFLKIAKVIRKFSLHKVNDWEQTEFDYNELTVRLCTSSSSKSYLKLNDQQNSNKLNPIFVKILKLHKDEKLNYVNKIKYKNEFNSVNSTTDKEFENFLTYSSATNNSKAVDETTVSTVDSSLSPSNVLAIQNMNRIDNNSSFKSLPRLLCRKRSLLKPKLQKTDSSAHNGDEKISDEKIGVDKKTTEADDLKTITPTLCKYRSTEYSSIYYDPFKDEKLILPLYEEFGRHNTDELSDVLNNIIKGVCMYDDHLKSKERKRIESEERKRNFLNFTQKILHDTKIMSATTSTASAFIPTQINSFPTSTSILTNSNLNSTRLQQYSTTNKATVLPNLFNNKEKIIYTTNHHQQQQQQPIKFPCYLPPPPPQPSQTTPQSALTTTTTTTTFSTIPNKRITPILPKLPPCIKIISNNKTEQSENKMNINKSNCTPILTNTVSNNANIITKLLSKPGSTVVTQSQNYLINTKIFSTSSVNHKTQVINTNQTPITTTTASGVNPNITKISTTTTKLVTNKDDTQQYKTFVKLVSLNNNSQNENTSLININNNKDKNDSSILKSNLQLIKVSSKIVKSPPPTPNEIENKKTNNNLQTITIHSSLSNTNKVNLNFHNKVNDPNTTTTVTSPPTKKIFIKSQNFNNIIMTPVNSNSQCAKTIYKILPKSNEVKEKIVESSNKILNDLTSKPLAINFNRITLANDINNNNNNVNNNKNEVSVENQSVEAKCSATDEANENLEKISIPVETNKVKLTDNTIALRKRKRKQDFSELLHKCVTSNQFISKLSSNVS